jgi:hypothetical protein
MLKLNFNKSRSLDDQPVVIPKKKRTISTSSSSSEEDSSASESISEEASSEQSTSKYVETVPEHIKKGAGKKGSPIVSEEDLVPIYEDYMTEPAESSPLELTLEKTLEAYLKKTGRSLVPVKETTSKPPADPPKVDKTETKSKSKKKEAHEKKLLAQFAKSFESLHQKLKTLQEN